MNTVPQGSAAVDDKAGRQHWDEVWSSLALPAQIDPRQRGLDYQVNRSIFNALRQALQGCKTQGARLLEIGCAQSAWLPVFAREFGFEVCGLDYSELGCERTRRILERDQVAGNVVCADMFSPPPGMSGSFDCVVSFGVLEHFRNTSGALAAAGSFLKAHGRLITLIPNMRGLCGTLQRVLNRRVYEMHVPLNREDLVRAHAIAGLTVRYSSYVLGGNLCVLNLKNLCTRPLLYRMATRWQWRISKGFWALETVLPFPIHNRWTSPYLICVGER